MRVDDEKIELTFPMLHRVNDDVTQQLLALGGRSLWFTPPYFYVCLHHHSKKKNRKEKFHRIEKKKREKFSISDSMLETKLSALSANSSSSSNETGGSVKGRLIGEKHILSSENENQFSSFHVLHLFLARSLSFRSPMYFIATYRFQEYFDGSIVSCYFELYQSENSPSRAKL